jgi:hypothetical protein
MHIVYTEHLKTRLLLRQIEYALPEKIFAESMERYYDVETGHRVVVKSVTLFDRVRETMVAYVEEGDEVRLLTIHPLKDGQKDNRIATGRWRKL